MKRNNPETSKAAFKSLNPDKLNELHLKILAAMQFIGECTYEDVANFLHLEPQRIWRRMSELKYAIERGVPVNTIENILKAL